MWAKTFKVCKLGGSKVIFLPAAWKIEKGEWLHLKTNVNGQTYHETCKVGKATTNYCVIPAFWPYEAGDYINLELAFAESPAGE